MSHVSGEPTMEAIPKTGVDAPASAYRPAADKSNPGVRMTRIRAGGSMSVWAPAPQARAAANTIGFIAIPILGEPPYAASAVESACINAVGRTLFRDRVFRSLT